MPVQGVTKWGLVRAATTAYAKARVADLPPMDQSAKPLPDSDEEDELALESN